MRGPRVPLARGRPGASARHDSPPTPRPAGFWQPAAACARAVDEAVAALRAAGHHVEEWNPAEKGTLAGGEGAETETPLSLVEAAYDYFAIMSAEGGFGQFIDALQGEGAWGWGTGEWGGGWGRVCVERKHSRAGLHPNYKELYSIAAMPGWLRSTAVSVLRWLGKERMARLLSSTSAKSFAQFAELSVRRTRFQQARPGERSV